MIKPVEITQLGAPQFRSPFADDAHESLGLARFKSDADCVPLHLTHYAGLPPAVQTHFQVAGPRERIFFNPATTRAGIFTCGGLCPGLNNVIRSIFLELYYHYKVSEVLGFQYGYHGLNPMSGYPPMTLGLGAVSNIHESGGTVLGTSRGPQDTRVMVDYLKQLGVSILFPVGGDGTQRGALAIHEEAQRQGYPLAVVGVPKTIDNDIQYVSRTFGFDTAVEQARNVIDCAHNEARAVFNGIGLVKLMGRDSGFIAASAALASGEVNYVLIPEIPFDLEGPRGLLTVLEQRLSQNRHAVIVVAEGAGQHLIPRESTATDASGNILHADIGIFLRDRFRQHFAARQTPVNVRYIDPSYIIRGLMANTQDAVLCDRLARHAVHAAMAGKSGLIIGLLNDRFIHVPVHMAVEGRKQVVPSSSLWNAVLSSTGQPLSFVNTD
jgi:6-phosphofructokinase 1